MLRGRPELPFGGIQLIFAGDFFQLGAVDYKKVNLYRSEHLLERDDLGANAPADAGGVQLPIAVEQFSAQAFKSCVWQEARFTYVKLDKMSATPPLLPPPSVTLIVSSFRQSDSDFINCLGMLRLGEVPMQVGPPAPSRVCVFPRECD